MNLTPAERELAQQVGFDEATVLSVKELSRKKIERLIVRDEDYRPQPADGLSMKVSNGEEAERVMKELAPRIGPGGYRAFWSERRASNGRRETHEVVVLKTDDPYAMIRLRRSDGGNYGITTEDIIDRLTAWREIADFTVVGASSDWVALVFSRLPERICDFAAEINQFCPDSVGQGVGLVRERDDPASYEAARKLCPEVTVKPRPGDTAELLGRMTPEMADKFKDILGMFEGDERTEEMGIRLLAHKLRETNYLFLWWD